jgi:exopolyphosphatase/guanosine-5'-triphosphate,3'-diphosphate pyrophosphatase
MLFRKFPTESADLAASNCHIFGFGFGELVLYFGCRMETTRRAVIDVGTNSVKLLVADVSGRAVNPIHEESRQTRLGKGFYESHILQPEPIALTAKAVEEFAAMARSHNTSTIRVIATSAARDAMNSSDLTGAIECSSGLQTEIISGAREAEWAFQGVVTDAALAEHPLLLLDVGGGSTEFIVGCNAKIRYSQSFPLGTVRLMERTSISNPPKESELNECYAWLEKFLNNEVRPEVEPSLINDANPIRLVGTGGTASILACIENKIERFNREKIDQTILSLEEIASHRKKLWSLSLEDRQLMAGVPADRADVILFGVLIYESVMKEFNCSRMHISTRGLRFAALINNTNKGLNSIF